MKENGIIDHMRKFLELEDKNVYNTSFDSLIDSVINAKNKIRLAIIGKYCSNPDSYQSLTKALEHAC